MRQLSSIIVPRTDNKVKRLAFTASGDKQYTFLLADIVTLMDVLSSLSTSPFRQALTTVTLGSNVSSIGPSCFIGCENLYDVKTYPKLKIVDDYAFKDCTNLKSVTMLGATNKAKVNRIGVSAFANTGLESISVSLSGTSTMTLIMPYAFASCKKLKSMTNVGSNYLADYEFADCTALTSVNLANSHSFCGEYVFLNCIALSSVVIPANTFNLNNNMFEGCSSLTSVTFKEPSLLNMQHCIDNFVFSGTKLTSITFPASVSSYICFNDYALYNMPYLKEIHFNGISISSIGKGTASFGFEYEPNFIYANSDDMKDYGVFKENPTLYLIEDYFKVVSQNTLDLMISECTLRNIPLVVLHGKGKISNCGNCGRFANKFFLPEFLNWIKSANNKYVIIDYASDSKIKGFSYPEGTSYVVTILRWKSPINTKSDVVLGNTESNSKTNTIEKFINLIDTTFNGYDETSANTLSYVISADIYNSHCFGLNHDVYLYGNDSNRPMPYKEYGASGLPEIFYALTTLVDSITTDDFRFGLWYRNALQIREYADKNNLPVLVECGSKNCEPCEVFLQLVFNDPYFLKLVQNQSRGILLHRPSGRDSFVSGPDYYTANEWLPVPERPEGKLPFLMMYWKRKGGSIDIATGTASDLIVKKIAVFIPNDHGGNYTLLLNRDDVIAWLRDVCFGYLNDCGYEADSKYYKPDIYSYLDGYPRYSIYSNLPNDTYGRYFPVESLQAARHGIDDYYTVNVRNEIGVLTLYAIDSLSTEDLPPDGTYLYFTMLSDESTMSSWYETNYDISGIIFKVGSSSSLETIAVDSYLYGNKLCSAYLEENELNEDTIASSTSSFYDDAYVFDDNGDPTTEVNIENAFAEDEKPYNIEWKYMVKDKVRNRKTVSVIVMHLSAEVQRAIDDETGDVYLDVVGDLYMMLAWWKGYEEGIRKVLWLSVFHNYE